MKGFLTTILKIIAKMLEIKNLMGGAYESPALDVIVLQIEDAVLSASSVGGAGFDDLEDGGNI